MIVSLLIAIILIAIIFYAVTLIPDGNAQNIVRVVGIVIILLWLLSRIGGVSLGGL